jgi:hypothetical protein
VAAKTFETIQVSNTGVSIALGAVSAGSTLPTNSAGATPWHVRLSTLTGAFVRFGNGSTPTAVATDLLVMPNESVIVNSAGYTHVAALQAATGGVLIVTPVEA